jgi:hypothetical protein
VSAGQNVAGTAKEQASAVASEAATQAKDLIKQTQSELREQAGVQQQRVATGLRSLSDELGSMANNADSPGVASDLVQQAATRAGSVATWLDGRDPGALLDEVKSFARKRPGTFIGLAAVAGVVAGRLTRSLTSVAADEKNEATPASSTTAPETLSVTPGTPVVNAANSEYSLAVDGPFYEGSATATPPTYGNVVDPLDDSPVDGDPLLGERRP